MLFRRFMFLLFTICFSINILCLSISVISPYINPKFFWPPALFGLFFKIFFVVQIIFTIAYIWFRSRRGIIIGIIGLLISIPALSRNVALHFSQKQQDNSKRRLRLMTHNVSSFDWNRDTMVLQNIKQNIKEANPDILCLQEYHIHPRRRKMLMRFLKEEMGFRYYYEYITAVVPKNNRVGEAIFSKIPLHNLTPLVFSNTANGAFFVDIYLPKDTFRLINVHFQSFSLKEREYVLPRIIKEEARSDFSAKKLKFTLQKFRRAFRKRSYQSELVDSVINNSPYKIIICGDFNDTPNSYLYQTLTKTLKDTYLETGLGIGSTFAGKIPALRIDYILADPAIKPLKTFVLKRKAGDHYPVITDFALP